MLTRRENLLIRPWQQRRYQSHRRKVKSALPVIDVGPPPHRMHVCCKLKKMQHEFERSARIEEDNFRLLERMATIMRTKRLDNEWDTEPPGFLKRVKMYREARSASPPPLEHDLSNEPVSYGRKNRCMACCPPKEGFSKLVIPEERIPWEPVRLPTSIVVRRSLSEGPPEITAEAKSSNVRKKRISSPAVARRLVISRGTLELSVNFPPHTAVRYQDGKASKLIERDYCECKAMKYKGRHTH